MEDTTCPMCGKGVMRKISVIEECIDGSVGLVLDLKRCSYCGQKLAYERDSFNCVMCGDATSKNNLSNLFVANLVCSDDCYNKLQEFRGR